MNRKNSLLFQSFPGNWNSLNVVDRGCFVQFVFWEPFLSLSLFQTIIHSRKRKRKIFVKLFIQFKSFLFFIFTGGKKNKNKHFSLERFSTLNWTVVMFEAIGNLFLNVYVEIDLLFLKLI
jgi:hypothetical protein